MNFQYYLHPQVFETLANERWQIALLVPHFQLYSIASQCASSQHRLDLVFMKGFRLNSPDHFACLAPMNFCEYYEFSPPFYNVPRRAFQGFKASGKTGGLAHTGWSKMPRLKDGRDWREAIDGEGTFYLTLEN
jgi:hypothetical protein